MKNIRKKVAFWICGASLALGVEAYAFDLFELGTGRNKQQEQDQKVQTDAELESVIEQYRSLISTTPEKTRKEIMKYRAKVAELNEARQKLYDRLPSDAKAYLQREEQYRRKLPTSTKDYPHGLKAPKKKELEES